MENVPIYAHQVLEDIKDTDLHKCLIDFYDAKAVAIAAEVNAGGIPSFVPADRVEGIRKTQERWPDVAKQMIEFYRLRAEGAFSGKKGRVVSKDGTWQVIEESD